HTHPPSLVIVHNPSLYLSETSSSESYGNILASAVAFALAFEGTQLVLFEEDPGREIEVLPEKVKDVINATDDSLDEDDDQETHFAGGRASRILAGWRETGRESPVVTTSLGTIAEHFVEWVVEFSKGLSWIWPLNLGFRTHLYFVWLPSALRWTPSDAH